ncbi:MAG: hypothetical protein WA175_10235 [Candidatus Acidiferrales bacterium]
MAPPNLPSSTLAPSTLAQWFGAAGTIAAVVVALFKDSILACMRQPRLDATCGKETPWTVKVPIAVHDGKGAVLWSGDCYFVRANVQNSGRTRAERVQVYASKLAKLGADGKFAEISAFLPLNMKWSNSPPGAPVTILDGISPKMGAFCDIVSLCDPANPHQAKPAGTPPNTTIGELQLEVQLLSGIHLLLPGTYRLTLRIAAANVEPIEKVFEFKHTGLWLQDDVAMRRDCLSVSLE